MDSGRAEDLGTLSFVIKLLLAFSLLLTFLFLPCLSHLLVGISLFFIYLYIQTMTEAPLYLS